VRDALTGRFMSKGKSWDMGHRPGYEFRKYQEWARKNCISREEFLKGYNNPDHYRPELPSSNRSHRGESNTNNFF
jgi:HNH/ENDO VII superfamily nuclease